jgi:3-phenylpropionate/cinnamic acid dioxygenase small subunit
MNDREAITDLVSRLGLWLDEKRFDETAPLFTDDVTVSTPGGQARGVDRVAAQARRNHGSDGTQHVITNVLVDVEGDRATARANLIVTFVPDPARPELHRTHGERYRFEAARTPAGWRLAAVEVTPVWVRQAAAAE